MAAFSAFRFQSLRIACFCSVGRLPCSRLLILRRPFVRTPRLAFYRINRTKETPLLLHWSANQNFRVDVSDNVRFSGTFGRTEASQLCSNIDKNTAQHLHSATKHSKDSMPLRTPKHRLIEALVGFSLTCFHAHSRVQKDGS
jgi:hypothetical protein